MPDTAVNFVEGQTRHWAVRAALGQPHLVRRGQPLPGAANGEAIVERVSNAARLDVAMRHQLVRILTVTVQDWIRK